MSTQLQNDRIDAIDALRGFALAGIVIAHMLEQFTAAPRVESAWSVESTLIDNIIMGLSFLLINGKFFSIFSVLFGISFAIMMKNAASKGINFSGRFVWRLAILLLFGIGHALVYRGDILTVYVSLGFILPLFYSLSSRWLWFISLALFLGAGRYAFFIISGKTTMLSYQLTPEAPQIIEYLNILQNGSFIDVAIDNFKHGFASKFDFQFAIFGRGYLTLGYFLVGMWLVRSGLMLRLEENRPLMKRILWQSILVAIVCIGGAAACFMTMPQPMQFDNWVFLFGLSFVDMANISLTATLMCGFLLLYLRKPKGWLGSFVPYGRMALSNYLAQSLFGAVLFFGWGLGLLGKLHDWQTLLLSFAVIALQIQICRWWLKRFNHGPLEWLWRAATYLKPVRFSRKPQTA